MEFVPRGGFGDLYNGQFCEEHRDCHVFSDRHYSVCECGFKKRVRCRCEGCGDSHCKTIDTTAEDRVAHELQRLHLRLSVLESAQRAFMEAEISPALKALIIDDAN